MELLIDGNNIVVSGLSFPPGSGVASFIRLGLNEINRLYNEVIISCVSAPANDTAYVEWAEKKLFGLEKSCFYMAYYNQLLKEILFSYSENGRLVAPGDYYSVIPELKKQSLLNYVNQEIDTLSRNKVLINFISQKVFDGMTELEKDEKCKALMHFLYFRDAILYNISAFQKLCDKKADSIFGDNADKTVYEFSSQAWYCYDGKLSRFTETIRLERAEQLVDIEMMKLLNSGGVMKECKSCGRYFVPLNRSDAIYCTFTDSGTGKSCAQTGALMRLRGKVDGSPAHKEYNRAYKRNFARVRAGKLDGEKYRKWGERARELRDRCVSGKISLEEFTAFLDKPIDK